VDAGCGSGGAPTGRIFGIGTARPIGADGTMLPVAARANTAGRRRGKGMRPLIG
jgi:hypothetical protein